MREGILITDRNRRRCLLLSFSLLVPAFGYDPYPATMPRNLVSGTVMCYQVYWTATSHKADATKAWTVFSCDFGTYDALKNNPGYTLAVRSAQEPGPYQRASGLERKRQAIW